MKYQIELKDIPETRLIELWKSSGACKKISFDKYLEEIVNWQVNLLFFEYNSNKT